MWRGVEPACRDACDCLSETDYPDAHDQRDVLRDRHAPFGRSGHESERELGARSEHGACALRIVEELEAGAPSVVDRPLADADVALVCPA